MNDGCIQLSCFSYKFLVLFMLGHCMGHFNRTELLVMCLCFSYYDKLKCLLSKRPIVEKV